MSKYDAGVRFSNECFVRTEYDTETNKVDVTVITPETTLKGSTVVEVPAAKKTRSK